MSLVDYYSTKPEQEDAPNSWTDKSRADSYFERVVNREVQPQVAFLPNYRLIMIFALTGFNVDFLFQFSRDSFSSCFYLALQLNAEIIT